MNPTTQDDGLLESIKQLVAIPSTADNHAAIREAYSFMVEFVRANAPSVVIEEFESNGVPSFLAYRLGERPARFHVLLNGHLDVVPGKSSLFEAKLRDNKLYGRGVYDMKAAVIVLAKTFCEYVSKVPYALGLQIVADEEIGGFDGTLHQIAQGVRADFVVTGESGRTPKTHEIANEAKGIVIANVVLNGNSSHGAYPWRGNNAAAKAARFVHMLHARFPEPTEESPDTTFTVTTISASGGSHTRTPDTANVKLDVRYAPGDPNFRSREHVKALLKEIDPDAETEILVYSAPLYSDPKNPLLLSLKVAAEHTEKATFSLVRRHATSDGRHYGEVGDQACEFGIAGEHQHGDDEHITLDALHNYLATMRFFLASVRQHERDLPEMALTQTTA